MPNRAYIDPPLDANLYLSNAVNVTTSAGSTVLDFGAGDCFPESALVIQPITVTAGTITPKVQTADDAAFTSNVTDILTLPTVSATQTKQTIIPLANTQIQQRYFRLYYTTATSPDHTVTAFLSVGS